MLGEAEDNEEALDWDLDNSFADERRTEEDTEGDQEVPAEEASEVKERIGYL